MMDDVGNFKCSIHKPPFETASWEKFKKHIASHNKQAETLIQSGLQKNRECEEL